MAKLNRAARHSCSYDVPSLSTDCQDNHIITEFVHGSALAGVALVGMFAVLALGVWWFGW